MQNTFILFLTLILTACNPIDWVGGNFHNNPTKPLSPKAEALRNKAFSGFQGKELRDVHTHIVGMGTGGCEAAVNPDMLSWSSPLKRLEALIYLSATGVTDENKTDQQYIDRLIQLIEAMPVHGKYHILAFDWHYDEQGNRLPDKSTFYMSNDCVTRLAAARPDLFIPVGSVHPYRKDALDEINKLANKGVRYIKWLPNAHGIDAGDPRLDDYYRTMIANDMILLTHIGEEKAVEADDDQALGNPLCFRRPLDLGLKVIMAHVGSLGVNKDLDRGSGRKSNFDLFVRLLKESRYNNNLFGEISATVLFNHLDGEKGQPPALLQLLKRDDLYPLLKNRFLNGSDYPLPAINFLIWLNKFKNLGLLTANDVTALKEIYKRNPLEFDFVLKRSFRLTDKNRRLPVETFTIPTNLDAPYPPSTLEKFNTNLQTASTLRCRSANSGGL